MDSVDLDRRQDLTDPTGTSVWVDERIALDDAAAATSPLVMFEVSNGRFTADLLRSPRRRSGSTSGRVARRAVLAELSDLEKMDTTAQNAAQFVFIGQDARRAVARVVNRAAVGLDAGMPEHYLLVGSPIH
jgi:hypothetical protein